MRVNDWFYFSPFTDGTSEVVNDARHGLEEIQEDFSTTEDLDLLLRAIGKFAAELTAMAHRKQIKELT